MSTRNILISSEPLKANLGEWLNLLMYSNRQIQVSTPIPMRSGKLVKTLPKIARYGKDPMVNTEIFNDWVFNIKVDHAELITVQNMDNKADQFSPAIKLFLSDYTLIQHMTKDLNPAEDSGEYAADALFKLQEKSKCLKSFAWYGQCLIARTIVLDEIYCFCPDRKEKNQMGWYNDII